MFSFAIAIAFSSITALLYFVWNELRHARKAKTLNCKPPPTKKSKWPFGLDNLVGASKAADEYRLQQWLWNEHEEMGCVGTFKECFISDLFITSDLVNIQAILAKQFKDFSIGPSRGGAFRPMLGNGIFNSDGPRWEHSRALLRPQFSRDQVADLNLEQRHVERLVTCMPCGADGWTGVVDLTPMFFRFTIDSATDFLFGESLHMQPAYAEEIGVVPKGGWYPWANIGAAFDRGTFAIAKRAWLADLYWLYNPKSFREDCKELRRFADSCISAAINRPKAKDTESGRYVFLEALLQQTSDTSEIQAQLLNILLAGRDTTAGLLSYCFFYLGKNLDVWEKLRRTVVDEFGSYDRPKEISFARLKACTCLQHVMAETLRLQPSVPTNGRTATRDTTLPRGGGADGESPVYVRKGQEIGYHVYVLHRRKELWGEDADEFRPERWAGRKPGWEYLPFNGGPRVCLQTVLRLIGSSLAPHYLTDLLTPLFVNLGLPRPAIRFDRGWICHCEVATAIRSNRFVGQVNRGAAPPDQHDHCAEACHG